MGYYVVDGFVVGSVVEKFGPKVETNCKMTSGSMLECCCGL